MHLSKHAGTNRYININQEINHIWRDILTQYHILKKIFTHYRGKKRYTYTWQKICSFTYLKHIHKHMDIHTHAYICIHLLKHAHT